MHNVRRRANGTRVPEWPSRPRTIETERSDDNAAGFVFYRKKHRGVVFARPAESYIRVEFYRIEIRELLI